MSDLGPYHFYLEMRIARNRPLGQLGTDQSTYVENKMQDCHRIQTPACTAKLEPATEDYVAQPAMIKRVPAGSRLADVRHAWNKA